MKKLICLFTIIALVACKSDLKKEIILEETSVKETELTSKSTMNDYNKIVLSEEDNEKILLGRIDRQGLQRESFKPWFDENFEGHILDSVTFEKIKPLIEDLDLRVFMGTWCDDSQREIPALFKILDNIGFDEENLYLVAVDNDKKTPQGYENDYTIEYVPTIILSKAGKELGRFVEYAQENLEKDLYAILSGADYKHAYAE